MSIGLRGVCVSLYRRVKYFRDQHCMATQDAVDAMASEFGSRPQLYEVLQRAAGGDAGAADYVFRALMEGWVKPGLLERATGRGRDRWLDFLSLPKRTEERETGDYGRCAMRQRFEGAEHPFRCRGGFAHSLDHSYAPDDVFMQRIGQPSTELRR